MKLKTIYSFILMLGFCSTAFSLDKQDFNKNDPACTRGIPDTSNVYMSTKWYLNSLEKVAIYNEIFKIGFAHIQEEIKATNPKSGSFGVVFDIDETLLDNMQYAKNLQDLECKSFTWGSWNGFMQNAGSIATPGSANITCNIQKIGGKVVLVTGRTKELFAATLKNLNKVGICYDSVVFASSQKDTDKNSRFNAILKGNYKDLITSNKNLPPLNVIAYFGDNIQDFPEIHQKDAIKQDANSTFFKQFGTKYFSLTNPIYGSWMRNPGFNESSAELPHKLASCTNGIAKSSNLYLAAKWYLYSAEVRAQYNEIFNNAYLKIQNKVSTQKLQTGSWGAVFAIDNTILNNATYLRNKAVLECKGMTHDKDWYNSINNDIATPGARDLTCNIRKLGGHIVLVTNRNMNESQDVLKTTIDSLHKNGICFDKILFASTIHQDKIARFNKVLSKMNVVAYFGSKMEDFPDTKYSANYDKFGEDYFMLPNPIYGNWTASKF